MYMVTNTIQVLEGYGDAILERFKVRQGIEEMPGFKELKVMKKLNMKGYEEVLVHTVWEDKKAFENWFASREFHLAHRKPAMTPDGQKMVTGNSIDHYEVIVESDTSEAVGYVG
ncbi:antibiotic biosynthesis monooxygenase [Kurthia gibsonii]|uniref:antibiotic biosynthesis monooxygenase n=1 Tax=Kurthia TaxID=1649 RepID=UPI000745CCC0|nr:MULTISPECIES: antibiotic biosynthesis monooxygenase [Kurthia]AMA62786.1 antibiotic biosynthesis monooxygenase family protein [Kurthia sp. 11kri321]MEB6113277.1 antibiotic biosynthesis monooxygenase [Kurthia gibsonii]WIL37937.1 antibiotic biosynthesis monooxygenase [Kurthia sp. YJT4]